MASAAINPSFTHPAQAKSALPSLVETITFPPALSIMATSLKREEIDPARSTKSRSTTAISPMATRPR